MRRLTLLALVLGILLATRLVAVSSPGTRAQEAAVITPTPSGVTFESVAEGVAPLIAAPTGVQLEWARFAPGAHYAVPADDASLLLVVESGTLTVLSSAPLVVNRAATMNATGAEMHEVIAAGTEITLAPGDSFVRSPRSEQEVRNSGGEPAVALIATIAAELTGEPAVVAATPDAHRDGGGLVVALAVVVVPECSAGYIPAEIQPMATPGGGGGGGGAGGVAVAIAAAPECVGGEASHGAVLAATPEP